MPDEQAVSPDTNKGKKVLLIEDDSLILKMYQSKFKNSGFEVAIAEDGLRALSMVNEFKPDIILLDIMMPQMSGIEFLKKLRNSESGKDIPVLILTNLSEKEEEQEASSLGVKEYLLKANLTPAEILEKVIKYI